MSMPGYRHPQQQQRGGSQGNPATAHYYQQQQHASPSSQQAAAYGQQTQAGSYQQQHQSSYGQHQGYQQQSQYQQQVRSGGSTAASTAARGRTTTAAAAVYGTSAGAYRSTSGYGHAAAPAAAAAVTSAPAAASAAVRTITTPVVSVSAPPPPVTAAPVVSAVASSISGSSASGGGGPSGKPLWQWNMEEVGSWLRGVQTLFPPRPARKAEALEAKANEAAALANAAPPNPNLSSADIAALARSKAETAMRRAEEIKRQRYLDVEAEEKWRTDRVTAEKLTQNLIKALHSASTVVAATSAADAQENTNTDMTPAQRLEKVKAQALMAAGVVPSSTSAAANTSTGNDTSQGDLYNILDSSFAKGKDVVHLPGAILSRLGVGGTINALSGVPGGVVDPSTNVPLPLDPNKPATTTPTPNPTASSSPSPTPNPENVHQVSPEVKRLSRILRRAVAARMEMDMMESTPRRVAEMLCPEVSMPEITAIRRRIYDTVILGRGTNASAQAAALENTEDLPVAAKTAVHDVDKWKKCKQCGNNDQSSFVLDKKNGDLICTECGTVAAESLMHEGSQFRKFEGEADRNHHGDAANPLYSNAHNMSTALGGVGVQSGAGVGWGMGSRRGLENILRNAHAYTEMNISQFGKEEKKTRIGYKDRQKKDAFMKMTHVGDALNLHDAVVQRAKELFAGFRDDRELVQQFKGVVAACLCEAFDQLSKDGKRILKVMAGDLEDEDADGEEENVGGRANWRKNMHNASAASTTVLSDLPSHLKEVFANEALSKESSPLELKPAATWDIDDCRTWLLEASRSISKQWADAREADVTLAAALPKGSIDELEGKLVEHTFSLCDVLEKELAQDREKGGGAGGRRRVNTPRVADMAHLSIRWQHSHERGSGGKGGVGNSGRTLKGTKPGERDRRTAGQVLLLKSAKKLSMIMKDQLAGEAFHKELRALLARQDTRKRKERSNESAQHRFKQMRRKPWLQARASS